MTVYANFFAAQKCSQKNRTSSYTIKKTPTTASVVDFLANKTVADFIETCTNSKDITLPKVACVCFIYVYIYIQLMF